MPLRSAPPRGARRRRAALCLAAGLAVTAIGCGDDTSGVDTADTSAPDTTGTPTSEPTTTVAAEPASFHPDGFGAVLIGMSEDEVREVAGQVRWEPAFEEGGCSSVIFSDPAELQGLSVDGETLGYLEVSDYEQVGLEASTEEGVALGDDEGRVDAVYDGVEVSTRPYAEEPDHWLAVDLDNGNRYIFGTTAGTIDQIRVGRPPDVDAIEGCA